MGKRILAVTILLIGCADVSVRKDDGTKNMDGFRYYLPRPYVLVKEEMPVGGGEVVLTGFGGLALGSAELSQRSQRMAVYLAGPLAQLLLAGVARGSPHSAAHECLGDSRRRAARAARRRRDPSDPRHESP